MCFEDDGSSNVGWSAGRGDATRTRLAGEMLLHDAGSCCAHRIRDVMAAYFQSSRAPPRQSKNVDVTKPPSTSSVPSLRLLTDGSL